MQLAACEGSCMQWHCSVEDVNMMCVHVLTSWAMQAEQEDKRRCRSDVRGGCGCAVMNELPRRAHPSELRDRETMRGGAVYLAIMVDVTQDKQTHLSLFGEKAFVFSRACY